MRDMGLIRMVLVSAAMATAVVVGMPAAGAEPGIPGTEDAHCQSYGLGNTAMACDGPIQPDGTWRRCNQWSSQPMFNGQGGMGGFIPGGSSCNTLGGDNPPPPWGTPPGHIDG